MKYFSNITEMIGKTPLLKPENYIAGKKLKANILLKIEGKNPAGSIKDRAALYMLAEAERSGKLKKGGVLIEPTSGNTGIALAALCAAKGYRLIIVMPETMSIERRKLIAAYGAELVLTPGALGMKGAIAEAEKLNGEIEGSIIVGQFVNMANPEAHYCTTAPEIWEDTDGEVDIFVAGVGTGGTVSGVGRYLKEVKPTVKIVAAEPFESSVLSGLAAAPHGIQGIGAGFIPKTMNVNIPDEILRIKTDDAMAAARELAHTDGLLIGISGGCNLAAATELAKRPENEGKLIVTVLPDMGDRYLSTKLYSEEK